MDQSDHQQSYNNLQHPREGEVMVNAKPNPISNKNIFTHLFFGWLSSPLKTAQKTIWRQDMHFDLDSSDQVEKQKKAFKRNFRRTGSIYKTIGLTYKWLILELAVVCVSMAVLDFVVINFSKKGMEIMQKSPDVTERDTFALLVFNFVMAALTSTLSGLLLPYYNFKTDRLSLRVRSILMSLTQEKTMSVNFLNFQKKNDQGQAEGTKRGSTKPKKGEFCLSEGTVSNIFQVDIPRIEALITSCYTLGSSSIMVITAAYYTVTVVGFQLVRFFLTCYIAFNLLYVLIYVFNIVFLRRFLEAKDSRMTYLKNVLQNLGFVKVAGLENFYAEKILQKRRLEIRRLIGIGLIKALSVVQSYFAYAGAEITFITYLSFNAGMISDYASFVAMSESIRKLKVNLSIFFVGVTGVIDASVCVDRIDKFLLAGEKVTKKSSYRLTTLTGALQRLESGKVIQVKNGFFRWSLEGKDGAGSLNSSSRDTLRSEKSPTDSKSNERSLSPDGLLTVKRDYSRSKITKSEQLNNLNQNLNGGDESGEIKLDFNFRLKGIDLEVDAGEVVAVFGKNNSGKSSLLYSILGEMVPCREDVEVATRGKIALLTQKRWIIKGTVLDNILLGSRYEAQRLREALRVSQLEKDIKTFSHGLHTLLGDTNDTVSGGQKARIAMARCFYQE